MSLPPVDFHTLGFQLADWWEAFACYGPGDKMGEPVKLTDEQVLTTCHLYRVDDDARRVIRYAQVSRPKGWAKSELAALIVMAELMGPVRCDGFDADGKPVGRAVRSPLIKTLATEVNQASLVFDAAAVMLRYAADTHGFHVDVGQTRIFTPDGGEVRPATASAAAKDGGKESFAVADETHLYVLPENRRMHDTLRRNLAKRRAAEPWMLATTTAYRPGEESVAEVFTRHAEAMSPEELLEAGLLLDDRRSPVIEDRNNDDEVRAGLKAAYGDAAEFIDLDRLMLERHDPTTEWHDFERYYLNRPVKSSNQWMAASKWRDRAREDELVADGEPIALGFDGSVFWDASVLVGSRLSDGHLFVLGVWQRPEGPDGDGWEVPRAEVDAAVHDAFRRFDVRRFHADPPYWQSEVDAWSVEWPEVVAAFWTNRDAPMSRALERLHTAVMAGEVTHDGNPDLAEHVANAVIRRTRSGDTIRKERPKSDRKIDGAVAAALAFDARADALAAGDTRKQPARFYSF